MGDSPQNLRPTHRVDLTLPPCENRWNALLKLFLSRDEWKSVLISRAPTEPIADLERKLNPLGVTLRKGVLSVELHKASPISKSDQNRLNTSLSSDETGCQLTMQDHMVTESQLTVVLPPCDQKVLGFLYSVAAGFHRVPDQLCIQYAHHHDTFLDHIEALRSVGIEIGLRVTKRHPIGLWSTLDVTPRALQPVQWSLVPGWFKKLVNRGQHLPFLYLLSRCPADHRIPGVHEYQELIKEVGKFFTIRTQNERFVLHPRHPATIDDFMKLFGHGARTDIPSELVVLEESLEIPERRRQTKNILVAIDGPAGAGKSTVSKLLARRLNYQLIDTGAMFRAVATCSLEQRLPEDDICSLEKVADSLSFRFAIQSGENLVYVQKGNGEWQDWSQRIRASDVGSLTSKISVHGSVRSILLGKQRTMGRAGGIVMEGRDVGSVVFPDAELKFFLTASVRARAQRRWRELIHRGEDKKLEDVEEEIRIRDERDSQREVAPLVIPDGAEVIDASDLSLLETVDLLQRRVASYLE